MSRERTVQEIIDSFEEQLSPVKLAKNTSKYKFFGHPSPVEQPVMVESAVVCVPEPTSVVSIAEKHVVTETKAPDLVKPKPKKAKAKKETVPVVEREMPAFNARVYPVHEPPKETDIEACHKLGDGIPYVARIKPRIESDDLVEVLLKTDDPIVYVTGKAGAGKSVVIRRLIQQSKEMNIIVVAPTGIASINCGGDTIHRRFRLSTNMPTPASIRETWNTVDPKTKRAIRFADLLIIDEVSMCRADILDSISETLKVVRDPKHPFGGLRTIMFGDAFQLPPVIKSEDIETFHRLYGYESGNFFDSHCMKKHKVKIYEMTRIFRQKESEKQFIEILNAVRENKISEELLDKLNSRVRVGYADIPGYVTICSTNSEVDTVNNRMMKDIHEPEMQFESESWGEISSKDIPCDDPVKVKTGAQVMVVKNVKTDAGSCVNGEVGVVTGYSQDQIEVEFSPTKKFIFSRETWDKRRQTINEKSELTTSVVGEFTQFPLRLAFAQSIHKTQGMTLDNVILKPDRIFASGQLYVALSRCRSMAGLVLTSPVNRRMVMADKRVTEWWQDMTDNGSVEQFWQRTIDVDSIKEVDTPESEPVNTEQNTFDKLVTMLRSGQVPDKDGINEIRNMKPEDALQCIQAGYNLFLDEIDRLRREIDSLKRRKNLVTNNNSLSGKTLFVEENKNG